MGHGLSDCGLTPAGQSAKCLGEFSRDGVRVGKLRLLADPLHDSGVAPFAPGTMVQLGIAAEQVRLRPA